MGLDIRLPIGVVFCAIGISLTIFGLVSNQAIYERSLGININLVWGLILSAFGVVMTLLGRHGTVRTRPRQES